MSKKAAVNQNTESTSCRNCSAQFKGNYCPECGQTKKGFNKPFKIFIVDFVGNMFAFDTRLWQTIKTVLFKPGKMTRDFMEGKRVRYMPPFRFYIFVSFVFFLLLNFQTKRQINWDGINVDVDTLENGDLRITGLSDETDSNSFKLEDVLTEEVYREDTLKDSHREVKKEITVKDSIKDTYSKKLKDKILQKISNEDSVFVTENLEDDKNSDKEIEENIKKILKYPDMYIERLLKYTSWSLFLLMPIFALLLLFFFRKTYKYYIAHLIFALNQHAFIFVVFIIMILVNIIFPDKEVNPENYLLLLPPVFLYIGAKSLYKRGWIRTFFSLLLILFIYGLLMIPFIVFITLLALNFV